MQRREYRTRWLGALVLLIVLIAISASAQDNDNPVGEFWPEVEAHIEFHDDWRLLAFIGLKKGEDFPYQQIYAGVGLRQNCTTCNPANLNVGGLTLNLFF